MFWGFTFPENIRQHFLYSGKLGKKPVTSFIKEALLLTVSLVKLHSMNSHHRILSPTISTANSASEQICPTLPAFTQIKTS